ncbi:MAG: hypothetical protein ABI203_04305 [Mucilaginibacter sp.]
MRKYFLITLLLLPTLSFAQSNYKSGYVVNLKSDTLRGFINLKEWGHNPKNISFKRSLSDKAQELGLSDINYFELTGYVGYHAYKVSISLNAIDLASPPSLTDTIKLTDNVFLKILQSGKNVTLYSYRDDIKTRFYIKENNSDTPTELTYGVYQDPNSDAKVVINKNTYKAQLAQLAFKYNPGDDKLIAQAQSAAYNEEDLIAVASKINGNSALKPISNSGSATSARFFAGAGFTSSKLTAGELYSNPSSKSSAPRITMGADLIINPAVGHLIFRIEAGYTTNSYNFTVPVNTIYNAVGAQPTYVKITQNAISITPQAIYNIYNGVDLKVFVDLGLELNFVSYPTNSGLTTKPEYESFQYKAGVVISKRLEIYGSYYPASNISDITTGDNDNLATYQVGVNYFFGKGAR